MAVDQETDLVAFATRISEYLRRAVKARAALEGRSVQDLVSQALVEYLENHDAPDSDAPAQPSVVTPGS